MRSDIFRFIAPDWKFLAEKLKQLAATESCEGEVQKLLNEYTSFLSDKGVFVLSFFFGSRSCRCLWMFDSCLCSRIRFLGNQ